MTSYQEATNYLYTRLPMDQRAVAAAYKPAIETVTALAAAFADPHRKLRTIHIAGTNGKGSTAHTLAAVLQSAGYRTGLFTSPHLIDVRERIRLDGRMIDSESVCRFVDRYRAMDLDCDPSFFELTTVMAFDYFVREGVDMAVVETGLGGRLDSTNILSPLLCVITNISLDHMAQLGDTLPAIAGEKAGIMKPGVPAVIGEAEGAVRKVVAEKAAEVGCPIEFACDCRPFAAVERTDGGLLYRGTPYGDVTGELSGDCQTKNAATILTALQRLERAGIRITPGDVGRGFAGVCSLTGLAGRWMRLGENPTVICDTGHNQGGWRYLSRQLSRFSPGLHMVIGFVNDKEINPILEMMPREARYYFTAASIPRAMAADSLKGAAREKGLPGESYPCVEQAYLAALRAASPQDTVFVGGSTFVVADLLRRLGLTAGR